MIMPLTSFQVPTIEIGDCPVTLLPVFPVHDIKDAVSITNVILIFMVFYNFYNVQVMLQAGYFIMSCPEILLIENILLKITTKAK